MAPNVLDRNDGDGDSRMGLCKEVLEGGVDSVEDAEGRLPVETHRVAVSSLVARFKSVDFPNSSSFAD